MKNIIKLVLGVSTIAVAFAVPAAPRAEGNRATEIAGLMQAWQARIVTLNIPVDDAKNWSRRNLGKFSRLNGERLEIAQRAATLEELELALVEPPLPAGTRLDILMANKPGDIAMMVPRAVAKSSPATTPASYSDLVFTALPTCRIMDTRPSQGGTGAWTAGSTNTIKIGPYPSGYASGPGAQGGSAQSCGLDALAGPGQVAVIMAAVSTVSQVGPGYLTFYPQGAPNPGLTSVSQWYQPGYVQTSFVLIPTDLVGTVAASGFTSAGTDVIIDVVGYFAAQSNLVLANPSTASAGNIMKGTHPFIHNFGSSNTFIGENAGNFTMTGIFNTGNGAYALSSNGPGGYNAAFGADALFRNFAGSNNSAFGASSLQNNTTGAYNTANGNSALFDNTSGDYNTASGQSALGRNTSGFENTGCGAGALALNATGSGNTASGASALASNTTGSQNTAFGYYALWTNTGSANIAIGSNAGGNLTSGNSNIAIGNVGIAAESGTLRIGTAGTQTRAFLAGIRGVTTGSNDAIAVLIDSSGQLGTASSSRRFKDDISDMDAASGALMKLRPVTFHYKSDQEPSARRLQYGLIAEEVAEVYPGLVAHSADGKAETVMYQFLAPMLLNEYQRQQRTIAELQAKTAEIAELKAAVAEIAELLRAAR